MAQQLSPWLEGAYGWNFGEGGWNTGMDQNLLKFSFMFDRNIDGIVNSLPAAVSGQAYYLTTDSRLYFAVGNTYFSTPVPKWFILALRTTGQSFQFNGSTLVQVDTPAQIDSRIDAVELTVSSLGTAAFRPEGFFASNANLDVASAEASAYTDALRSDLAAPDGAKLVGGLSFISPIMFGAVGDDVADDTAALNSMYVEAVATGAAIVDFTGNTYRYTSNIVVNGSVSIFGNCTFHGVNAFTIFQGSMSLVGNISAVAALGDDQFTASSVTGLARNDLLILQNTVASSFSPHRPEYYDGEFIRVASVAGSVVNTQSNLVTAYTGAVTDKIYKLTPITVVIEGVSFTGGNVYTLRVKYADGGRIACKSIRNTLGTSAAGSALAIDKSYNVLIEGGQFDLPFFSGMGLGYGINVINSERVKITGIDAFGGRHAVTTGGDAEPGAVPCRFIGIEDSVLRNDPASGVYCADFHGNTADSVYRNCEIYGRIGLAGENPSAIDCRIWSEPSTVQSPLGYHELVGGDLQFINCTVFLGAGSTPTSIVSNLSSSLTANISKPYKVIVRGLVVPLNASVTTVINAYDNSGQASSWFLDDFELSGVTSGLTSFLSYTKAGAGIEPLVVETTHPRQAVAASFVPIARSGATLAATRIRLYQQKGSSANGKFRKLEDGTMICTHKLTIAATAIDTAFLGGFRSGGVVWTFDVQFATEPEVTGIPTNASALGIVESTASVSSSTFFFTANASQTAATRDARLTAIGSWGLA